MNDDMFKHLYAFTVLVITICWGAFCVWITFQAIASLETADIVATAGANALLGALIVWNGNINQHYFRKKVTDEEGAGKE